VRLGSSRGVHPSRPGWLSALGPAICSLPGEHRGAASGLRETAITEGEGDERVPGEIAGDCSRRALPRSLQHLRGQGSEMPWRSAQSTG
jgi:hypothetical protein